MNLRQRPQWGAVINCRSPLVANLSVCQLPALRCVTLLSGAAMLLGRGRDWYVQVSCTGLRHPTTVTISSDDGSINLRCHPGALLMMAWESQLLSDCLGVRTRTIPRTGSTLPLSFNLHRTRRKNCRQTHAKPVSFSRAIFSMGHDTRDG